MAQTIALDERPAALGGGSGTTPATTPDEPRAPERARPRRRGLLVAGGFVVLVVAFAAHLAAYGAWMVDDAGISMAYAVNLVGGHGLVAMPGATPVEGFSNPLWVGVLAAGSRLGLLGGGSVLGVPTYVATVKGLAVLLHCITLVALGIVVRRIVTVVRGRPSFGITFACWLGAGALLAANPSYVVWMASGLENPLLAAEVAVIAALVVCGTPHPTRRAMVAIGAVSGLAALTHPDGAAYVAAVLIVAAAAAGATRARRWSLAWPGLVAFLAVFGGYLAFRVAYFGAWVPNTAVAKQQGVPTATDLLTIGDVGRAYGVLLLGITIVGSVIAWRATGSTGRRVLAAGGAVLSVPIAAYGVLPADWMSEFRFLTPLWPLLSAATALAAAQVIAKARATRIRTVAAVGMVAVASAATLASWGTRADEFHAAPTVPLCTVATRFGTAYEEAARVLGLDPSRTTILLPDIGGVLLATDLEIVDLAGLVDRRIARLVNRNDRAGLAAYALDRVQPTFIQIHGLWKLLSGLDGNPALRADYVAIRRDEGWVRRDALERTADPDATLARLRAVTARANRPRDPRAACGTALFGRT